MIGVGDARRWIILSGFTFFYFVYFVFAFNKTDKNLKYRGHSNIDGMFGGAKPPSFLDVL